MDARLYSRTPLSLTGYHANKGFARFLGTCDINKLNIGMDGQKLGSGGEAKTRSTRRGETGADGEERDQGQRVGWERDRSLFMGKGRDWSRLGG